MKKTASEKALKAAKRDVKKQIRRDERVHEVLLKPVHEWSAKDGEAVRKALVKALADV